MEDYWGKMLLGDGAIVLKEYRDYKVFKPAKKEYYFSLNRIENELKRIKEINYSERLRVYALVEGYKSGKKHSLVLIGMKPDRECKIISNIELMEGRFPHNDTKEIALFLSNAGRLDVGIGDSVIVYIKNIDGYMDFDLLTVSGIIKPKKTQYFLGSEIIGYIPLSFADSIKAVNKDIVSEVVFSSESLIKKAEINYRLPSEFKVVNMLDSEEIPLTMKLLYDFILWILFILIVGIVFSIIYYNVNLMIIERYREIGVYQSFGASKWWILKKLLGEFTLYIFYCSIIGIFFSTLIILGINSASIHATNRETEVVLCSSQFLIFLKLKYYVISFFILWMVFIIASLNPILKGVNEAVIVKLFRR